MVIPALKINYIDGQNLDPIDERSALERAVKQRFTDHMHTSDGGSQTFSNLIQEVINQDRCTQFGGCVSFCTAVNYEALGLDADGRPGYADQKKCIECGICYIIFPSRNRQNWKKWATSNGKMPWA